MKESRASWLPKAHEAICLGFENIGQVPDAKYFVALVVSVANLFTATTVK